MDGERRPRLVRLAGLALVALLVAAGAWAGLRAYQDATRPDLERALAWTPADSARFSWTDWEGVRSELDVSSDEDASASEVAALLDEGFEADLTSTTAMTESVDVLRDEFGVSPAVVSWELLAQSTTGSVLMLGLPHEFSFDDLEDALDDLGFERPDDETGVWVGGDELIASVGSRAGSTVSPQLAHWAVDRERHLVLTSDSASYLGRAVEAVEAEDGGDAVADVAEAVAPDPLSAVLLGSEQACQGLAMSQADDVDRAQADELVAAAGEVNPLTGFALAARPGGGVTAAMSFENDEQARTNADSRAVLASGPAPGQGGDFADRFELGDVVADGNVVTMDLRPVEGAYVVSDLSSGPVLFATC